MSRTYQSDRVLRSGARPKRSEVDPVTSLPLELGRLIFSYLYAKDLATCCFVSSSWRRLANDDGLWRNLLHQDKLQNEMLVPLPPVEDKNLELGEECQNKRFYNRGMIAIRNLARNNLIKRQLDGSLLTPMGNGSFLAAYIGSSILLYNTCPDLQVVQAVSIPPVNSCNLCVLMYASLRYLVLKLEHAYVCFKLEEGKLKSLGILNVVEIPDDLSFTLNECYNPSESYSTSGTSILALIDDTAVIRSPVDELHLVALDPLQRKARFPSLGPHSSCLVFNGKLFLSDPHSILCYDRQGTKLVEIPCHVERGWERTLQVNDKVILHSFYQNPRSDEVVMRLWNWEFKKMRSDFSIPARFPSPIVLRPKAMDAIHCRCDDIRCTRLLDSSVLWRIDLGTCYWNPTNQFFAISPHFLILATTEEYSLFDVRNGVRLFTNSEGSDCRYIYRNSNFKVLVFRDPHESKYILHIVSS